MLRQPSKLFSVGNRLVNNQMGRMVCARFSSDVHITTVPMPSLSPTMTHGSISVWNKVPGDVLSPGDVLCEIETDKASVGFEVQDDGILAKILSVANGGEVECGRPIALTVEDAAAYAKFLTLPESEYGIVDSSTSGEADAEAAAAVAAAAVAAASVIDISTPKTAEILRRMSPAARHMVQSQALDISKVVGSAKGGLITKGDVILGVKSGAASKSDSSAKKRSAPPALASSPAASSSGTPAVCPVSADTVAVAPPVSRAPVAAPQQQSTATPSSIGGAFIDIKNSNMRKVIAKRLTESKTTVPHQYTAVVCEIDELLELRKTLKADFGVNVSVNDVVIKAAALALRDVPECNGKWVTKTETVELNTNIDISVAVATPSGLITPIVTNADRLGLSGINKTVLDLATRARDGKLKPEEYQGGTFTISNLGMFGITSFNAVINPPQACILAVSGGVPRVLPPRRIGAEGPDGQPRVATTLTVQLSSDRRVVDEAIAAQYCQVFKHYLSNPKLIML